MKTEPISKRKRQKRLTETPGKHLVWKLYSRRKSRHIMNDHVCSLFHLFLYLWFKVQSRQSAKLFSSRRNWDSPTPSLPGECVPPPPLVGGGDSHSLAGEGVGAQIRQGDRHCCTLVIYVQVLCGSKSKPVTKHKS